MKKSVMILGAGAMQLPAIIAAKELGLYTLVVDGSDKAPSINAADEFVQIDLKDRPALLACAQEFLDRHHLAGVFTAGTDFSANVAYITQHCNLPGHNYEAAMNATDKVRMRECFQQQNVPSPKFVYVNSSSQLGELETEIQSWNNRKFSPVVVKPVDSMGSRGVIFVDELPMLVPAVDDALSYSRSGKVIIEEFMDGCELSLDALVYENEITICGIADRHIYYPPYFVERGHTLPSSLGKEVLEEVVSVFKRGVNALGLSHGAAKGDMKVTSSGVKIGEIAGRLSGGYMSGWTYPYASGVNLTKNALQLAIGERPKTLQPRDPLYTSAEWSFISIPGRVDSILYEGEAKNSPHIKEMFIRVQPGQEVQFPRNNVEKCGNFIAVHPNKDIAECAAKQAAATIFLRLEKGNTVTERFLFEETWPDTSSLMCEGYDINGNSLHDIEQQFLRITGCPWHRIPHGKKEKFMTAWQRGGLQGAVWFYDTYLRENL